MIDTETRHLTAEETRSVVFPIVRRAKEAGIPHIYLKTDSAMRGNAGAVFQAALEASGSSVLSFVPAFPQMDRTVREGKVYIGGDLLTDSFYAADPLNRTVSADAGEIIGQQCSYPVKYRSLSRQTAPSFSPAAVELWDTGSEDDLDRILACLLAEGKTKLMAGCAGFGSRLSSLPVLAGDFPGGLRNRHSRPEGQRLSSAAPPLLVLCGSIGKASADQVRCASERGFEICSLLPEEKYCPEYWQKEKGRAKLRSLWDICGSRSTVIGSFEISDADKTYCKEHGLSLKESAERTSGSIAGILSGLLSEAPAGTDLHILITGGDTLRSCLDTLGIRKIRPLYELMPGIVVSSVRIRGKEWRFISKSGGFGDADLFVRLRGLTTL